MLRVVFEYLFYIFAEYANIQKEEPILLWFIYVYNDVIQTLRFLNLLPNI